MNIGGYQPYSLCDYPGHIAVVVFTQGCNFRCPFCHNANLLAARGDASQLISQETILQRLSARRDKLDAVVVTGGEPTMQADLAQFLRQVRERGFHVKLDTNGSRPGVLAALFEARLLDYVAMDVKAPWSRYAELSGVKVHVEDLLESIRLIISSGVHHEFRTTAVGPLLDGSDLACIRAQIPSGSPYTVQPFRAQYALSAELRRSGSEREKTPLCYDSGRQGAHHYR